MEVSTAPQASKLPQSPQHLGSAVSTQSKEGLISSPTGSLTSSKTQSKSNAKGKKSKSKMPYFWNSDDVVKWLRKHCGQHHENYGLTFKENDISGRILVRLSENKLQRMGISNPEHREDLLRQILKLKLRTETQELKSLDQKGMSYER